MNIASWTVQPCDVPSLLLVAGAGARVEEAIGKAWDADDRLEGGGTSRRNTPSPAAVATMLASVREVYGGLQEGLRGASSEVDALLAKGNMGAMETQAVENMRQLILNALL